MTIINPTLFKHSFRSKLNHNCLLSVHLKVIRFFLQSLLLSVYKRILITSSRIVIFDFNKSKRSMGAYSLSFAF